ncbi:unnamed protein product [Leptidea sinapis]|uniref:Uncharacterized protein n=1 Tax=Leptidea sinapis TaxID=189913 RepID=A0A5E4Q2I4_9NEOP|nr:unnamed protein product [Leptidea sinapis]
MLTSKASQELDVSSPCLLMRAAEANPSASGVTRSRDIHSAKPEPSTSGISSSVAAYHPPNGTRNTCWSTQRKASRGRGEQLVYGQRRAQKPETLNVSVREKAMPLMVYKDHKHGTVDNIAKVKDTRLNMDRKPQAVGSIAMDTRHTQIID